MGDFSLYTVSRDYNLYPDGSAMETVPLRMPLSRDNNSSYEGLQEGLFRRLAAEFQDPEKELSEDFPGYSKELEAELEKFLQSDRHKEILIYKDSGTPLGISVVESGWGNPIPTIVVASIAPNSAAHRCQQLKVGDQILSCNDVSLVSLSLSAAKQELQMLRSESLVRLRAVPSSLVLSVELFRVFPGQKLGLCVEEGVIVSMRRGGLAERTGVRVGYRLLEINSAPVLCWSDEEVLEELSSLVGKIRLTAMQNSVFRILTRKDDPRFL